MKLKTIILGAAVACLLFSVAIIPASAQQTSGVSQAVSSAANSLRIAPVRTELALDPGASKEITVYGQNLTPNPVQMKVAISDFEASKDESGKPLVILDDAYAKSHSLKRLASVEPSAVTLPPNERVGVKVTITVPKSARAGGYYGAVRFLPADEVELDSNGVAVSTNVGSLVILKVNGDLKEKLTLESLDVRQENKPGTFFKTSEGLKAVVRFNNLGNIQEQPFGKVQVLDRGGKVIEEHEINNTDPRGNVLPESIRRFEVDLKKVNSFGKYTLQGNFGYGTNGELLTSKMSFWVVPTSYLIVGGVAIVAIILLAIFIPRVIGNYNRRIIRRAGRRY